ncbi:RICIN domain-containing protein [Streptomyces eurocidicus]|uniref:Ricin B lectin domain-containing protein n=1 Tax=Streptomyces eurocidicus TaxID=66423 RepID=A0A7W8B9Q6_STREU|nr:RICIN domain-containing protein [Streptomyces eurocidicus]MBB5117584.1 hypothetical protein [Streptomyces eurocidicus]MBF6053423.1 hypothetical protein [Streptomyces eurocidicus]
MKKIGKLIGLVMAALAAILLTPNVSLAINQNDTTLVNNWNWKCLEIDGSSQSNGARAQMWNCAGQAGARWKVQGDNGAYRIINRNSGKCLEIADSRTDNGAPVQQWSCGDRDTQRWKFASSYIYNVNSGKVIEIDNGSDANGARVQQWSIAGKTWQNWSYGNN